MQEKSGVGGGRLSPRRGPGPARPGKQREGEEVGGAQSTLGSGERPASEVRGPGGPARGTIGLAPAFLLRSVSSRGRQGRARRGRRLGVLVALLTRFLARPCCGLKTSVTRRTHRRRPPRPHATDSVASAAGSNVLTLLEVEISQSRRWRVWFLLRLLSSACAQPPSF